MKKLLVFALALVAFGSVAGAAPTCGTINWTIATLGATGCEDGDKIFSAFSGNMGTVNPNLVIQFSPPNSASTFLGPYNVVISDLTGASLNQNFTLNYTVTVDETGVVGGFNYITGISAGGVATFTPTASNSNTISGAGAGCTPLNSNNTGGGFPTVSCATTGLPTSVGVQESYTFTGGSNTVSSIQDSYLQAFQNTSTPEPLSSLLFGSGLLALSVLGRKRFARK
jgi:hypothetical protein